MLPGALSVTGRLFSPWKSWAIVSGLFPPSSCHSTLATDRRRASCPIPAILKLFWATLLNSPWIDESRRSTFGLSRQCRPGGGCRSVRLGPQGPQSRDHLYLRSGHGRLSQKHNTDGNLPTMVAVFISRPRQPRAIRDHLVQVADIVTPNLFELSWLTGRAVTDHQEVISAVQAFPEKTFLVTSMPGFMRGNIGNLLVHDGTPVFAEHRKLENPPNGPGDLTAALFLSHTMAGLSPEKALRKTTASVFEIIAGAARRGSDELMLETDASSIATPMTMVSMRNLTTGQQKKSISFKPAPF